MKANVRRFGGLFAHDVHAEQTRIVLAEDQLQEARPHPPPSRSAGAASHPSIAALGDPGRAARNAYSNAWWRPRRRQKGTISIG